MRTKECEVQYSLARFEQQRKLADNESTRSRTLSAQVSTFSQTETELRSQLNIYVEKFKQVRCSIRVSWLNHREPYSALSIPIFAALAYAGLSHVLS